MSMLARSIPRVLRGHGVLVAGLSCLAAGTGEKHRREAAEAREAKKLVLYSWGSNQFGQLGINTLATDQYTPQKVNEELRMDVKDVKAFGEASAVVSTEDEVYAFGRSTHGSLGQGNSIDNCTVPTMLTELNGKGVKSLSVGEFHMACVDRDGKLWTTGRNWSGEIGRGSDTTHMGDVKCSEKFQKVACGRTFTAAVSEDGKLFTWGNGKQGVLGNGSVESLNFPKVVKIPELENRKVVDIACGQEILLVATEDGKVFSCGSNDYLKLGYESSRINSTLRMISSLGKEQVVKVCCGDYHCAALTKDGRVFTWGAGSDGQLGHGTRRDVGTPSLISAFKDIFIKDISCGGNHTVAVSEAGEIYVWGKGRNGQLGAGDNFESVAAYHTSPKQVQFFKGSNVVMVAAGRDHTLCVIERK